MSIAHGFVLISFLLGILCIRFLQQYDIHEKEPIGIMLLVVLLGGGISIAATTQLYRLLGTWFSGDLRTSLGALLVIGPVEEAGKLIAMLLCLLFVRRQLNEPVDGLIYMACVALGFSLIENYMYATRLPDSEHLLFMRLLISTPAHVAFSIPMGLPVYLLATRGKGILLLIGGYLSAAAMHGVFDLIIFNGFWVIVLLLFMRWMFYRSRSLLGSMTALSPCRRSLSHFINTYPSPTTEDGIECLHCGNREPKPTYRLGQIVIQKCDQCGMFVSTKNSLYYIFHHFGSTFHDLSRNYRPLDKKYFSLFSANRISDGKRIGFFDLEELSDLLEEMNKKLTDKVHKAWWWPDGRTTGSPPLQPDRVRSG